MEVMNARDSYFRKNACFINFLRQIQFYVEG